MLFLEEACRGRLLWSLVWVTPAVQYCSHCRRNRTANTCYHRYKTVVCVVVFPLRLQSRLEVISHSSVSSSTSSPSPSPCERPVGPSTSPSVSTPQSPPQPDITGLDRDKNLSEWLGQNPGYSVELPTFPHVILCFLSTFSCYILEIVAVRRIRKHPVSPSPLTLCRPSVWAQPATVFCGTSEAEEASLQRSQQAGRQEFNRGGESSCGSQRNRAQGENTALLKDNIQQYTTYCIYIHTYFNKPVRRREQGLLLFHLLPVCYCSTATLQLGGAMAPTIKELSRWLDANSEYYVTPEWATVVKHSVSTTCYTNQVIPGGQVALEGIDSLVIIMCFKVIFFLKKKCIILNF